MEDIDIFHYLAISSDYLVAWRNKIVLVTIYTGKVMIINPETKTIEKIYNTIESDQTSLFRCYAVFSDKLMLVPFNADDFYCLDLHNGKITKLGIITSSENITSKYVSCILIGKDLWCVGENINNIICLNVGSKNITIRYKYEKNILWSEAMCIQKDKILIPSRNEDKLLIVDTKLKECLIKNYKIINKEKGFLDVSFYEKKIIMYDLEGNEYQISDNYGNIKKNNDDIQNNFVSRQNFVYKNTLYRIELYDDCLNYRLGSAGKYNSIKVDLIFKPKGNKSHILHGEKIGSKFFCQSRYGELLCFNLENNSVIKFNIVGTEFDSQIVKDSIFNNGIINEFQYDGYVGLQEFINSID
jgi:hypothetical protein